MIIKEADKGNAVVILYKKKYYRTKIRKMQIKGTNYELIDTNIDNII